MKLYRSGNRERVPRLCVCVCVHDPECVADRAFVCVDYDVVERERKRRGGEWVEAAEVRYARESERGEGRF